MAKPNRIASGKRFAADLKQLRASQGISVEDFHEETKISIALIESFEESGLFEHPMFNRVYLRSFVRTYADLLGLETETALKALERAIAGEYEHELREDEEIEPDGESAVASAEAVNASNAVEPGQPVKSSAGEEDSSNGEDQVAEAQDADAVTSDEKDAPELTDPGKPANIDTSAEDAAVSGVPADEGTERPAPEDLLVEEEEEVGETWLTTSPAAADSGETTSTSSHSSTSSAWSSRRRSKDKGTSTPTNVIAGAAVIVILGAIIFYLFQSGGTQDDSATGESNVVVDTVEADAESIDQRPPADITLGELMNFTVVAEGGPIQGIRITRDSDLRRPYWIEEGEATVYPARQRIVIEEQLQNVRLLLEGYNYPTDQRDDQGRIVINRETAEAFADTLRGEPYDLSVQPDTNQVPSP